MDVASDQFPSKAIKIIQEIAESHFVAIDFEFSGVAGWRPPGSGKLTLQEFYEETKTSAEKYQILQVGLAIVEEDLKEGHYVVRPYNFNLSPIPALHERTFVREWSCTSGSMNFLARNGFDHALPFTMGVHYLSRQEESDIRTRMIEEDAKKIQYADMEAKPGDEVVINHIRTSIRNWLAQPVDQREDYVNVPGEGSGAPSTFNRYQIRLTHQVVRNEFNGLHTKSMGHFVRVTSPTEEQQMSLRQRLNEDREKVLNDAIGFRWIIEAIFGGNITNLPPALLTAGLSYVDLKGQPTKDFIAGLQLKLRQRTKVLAGHNCFGDLIYMYRCFIGPLPELVEDFAAEMNMLCPAIIDTKHLASFAGRWGDTSLATAESSLQQEKRPVIKIPSEYDQYTRSAKPHEAGYDAQLTAYLMIRLSAKMEREAKYLASVKFFSGDSTQSQLAFGEDEGYVTAVESTELQKDATKSSLTGFERVTVAAVKSFFEKNVGKLSSTNGDRSREHTTASNIFEVLDNGEQTAMPREDTGVTVNTLSQDGSSVKGKGLDSMVKRGEIIPRWDGVSGFWKCFGNKLQTNSCKEDICDLKK